MSYWEPPGEDDWEMHVKEAELYLDMTDEDIRADAAAMGVTVAEYRRWREQKIERYRQVNPDHLTPDQNRRLFRDLAP